MSQMIAHEEAVLSEREGALVKKGHDESMKEVYRILEEYGFPLGLLPLSDVSEIGFVKSTGFFWVRQPTRVEHYFKKISKLVGYGAEITGYIEHNSIKKLSGVSAKLLLWLSVNEIAIDLSSPEKIQFKGLGGSIQRTFPVDAFASAEYVVALSTENMQ